MRDKQLRNSLAYNGVNVSTNYSVDIIGKQWINLFLKLKSGHNEYEQAWIKMEQAQQQASQSNNTTLSDSHAAQLAQNRASSNSNSNENSCSAM